MTQKISRGTPGPTSNLSAENLEMERTKIIESSYIVCDGCGYVIGWSEDRVTMKMQERDTLGLLSITDDLHFHLDPPRDKDGKAFESNDYKRDCVAYWWSGRRARAEREKKTDGQSE